MLTGVPAQRLPTLVNEEDIGYNLHRKRLANRGGEGMEHAEAEKNVVRVGKGTPQQPYAVLVKFLYQRVSQKNSISFLNPQWNSLPGELRPT